MSYTLCLRRLKKVATSQQKVQAAESPKLYKGDVKVCERNRVGCDCCDNECVKALLDATERAAAAAAIAEPKYL